MYRRGVVTFVNLSCHADILLVQNSHLEQNLRAYNLLDRVHQWNIVSSFAISGGIYNVAVATRNFWTLHID